MAYEKETLVDIANTQLGLNGVPTFVTNTSENAMNAVAFYILIDDTRIASITINGTVFTSLAAIDLKMGAVIYGVITSVTLSQGAGIGYAGKVFNAAS